MVHLFSGGPQRQYLAPVLNSFFSVCVLLNEVFLYIIRVTSTRCTCGAGFLRRCPENTFLSVQPRTGPPSSFLLSRLNFFSLGPLKSPEILASPLQKSSYPSLPFSRSNQRFSCFPSLFRCCIHFFFVHYLPHCGGLSFT